MYLTMMKIKFFITLARFLIESLRLTMANFKLWIPKSLLFNAWMRELDCCIMAERFSTAATLPCESTMSAQSSDNSWSCDSCEVLGCLLSLGKLAFSGTGVGEKFSRERFRGFWETLFCQFFAFGEVNGGWEGIWEVWGGLEDWGGFEMGLVHGVDFFFRLKKTVFGMEVWGLESSSARSFGERWDLILFSWRDKTNLSRAEMEIWVVMNFWIRSSFFFWSFFLGALESVDGGKKASKIWQICFSLSIFNTVMISLIFANI